jgi:hypothetical protein
MMSRIITRLTFAKLKQYSKDKSTARMKKVLKGSILI